MTKTQRKAGNAADEAFHRHYTAIWGQERWHNSLYPALVLPTRYACLVNRFASSSENVEKTIQDPTSSTVTLELPRLTSNIEGRVDQAKPSVHCYIRYKKSLEEDVVTSKGPSETPFPPPEPVANGLLSHWNLDAASVLVAHLLGVQPGEKILDFCAAPGGKSMVLAHGLWPQLHVDAPGGPSDNALGYLRSNEMDGPRNRRLAANLAGYLPRALLESQHAQALRLDGTKAGVEHELRIRAAAGSQVSAPFDRILVDAPCSSERHIIHSHVRAQTSPGVADEMATWRPGASKRLAGVQKDLLMAALRAVRAGGTVMYATCAIDPTENDGVVEKTLAQVEKDRKKGAIRWSVKVGFREVFGDEAVEAELEMNWAERTKFGWIALPDHPAGGQWGPLFFAILKKVAD